MENLAIKKGIYLAKRPAHKMGGFIDHYGIIDIGNVTKLFNVEPRKPLIYHQIAGKGLMCEYLEGGEWMILGKVREEHFQEARERLIIASRNPDYDIFVNNCEQFARFVTEGKKESRQLQVAATIAGLALFLWLVKED